MSSGFGTKIKNPPSLSPFKKNNSLVTLCENTKNPPTSIEQRHVRIPHPINMGPNINKYTL